MDKLEIQNIIASGQATLGIELGSTRIKAVLIAANFETIAKGSHQWENQYIDDNWTYSLDDVWLGIQSAYADLIVSVKNQYDVQLTQLAGLGISAMMHGYLAFDKQDQLLTPFRTWRNNNTSQAASELMELFQYPMPQRWSISHLYQSILNGQSHVDNLDFMTTLAGYVHWQLCGQKVLGVGDASGVFPIDIESSQFDTAMIKQFDDLVAPKSYPWKLVDILPNVLTSGQVAGQLTEAGARLLDPSGQLQSGSPLCPPEGDAGTGMVATNSVAQRTGNVSAGTSIFAMIVLEGTLSKLYPDLDLVTTPDGKLVAMAHSNNCTSDINAWVDLFEQAIQEMGFDVDKNSLYEKLFTAALRGEKDGGGLLSYGYLSGEHMTHFEEGRPLLVRSPESRFNLENLMRVTIQTAFGAMKIGIDQLVKEEGLKLDKILAHGGLFTTPKVAQSLLAGALNTPVSVMNNAGEGGAWGIALLAAYLDHADVTLGDFLNNNVFAGNEESTLEPDVSDVEGFERFMQHYHSGLAIERAAVDHFKID